MKTKIRPIWLIALILWMVVIFMLSAEDKTQSGARSGMIVSLLVKWFAPQKIGDVVFVETMHHLVRKGAHFMAYLVLGMLTVQNARAFVCNRVWLFAIAILFCFLYASSDEIHQWFSHRGAMFSDVLLDTAGAGVGVFLGLFVWNPGKKNE